MYGPRGVGRACPRGPGRLVRPAFRHPRAETEALYDDEEGDDNEYEGGFLVAAASRTLDGSQECDGAAVLNAPPGARYPDGLLVVRDGRETPAEDGREATGFKFVDLADVMDAVDD